MEFIKTATGIFIARDNISALEVTEVEGKKWIVANLKYPILQDPKNYANGGETTHICRISPVSEQLPDDAFQQIFQTLADITFRF